MSIYLKYNHVNDFVPFIKQLLSNIFQICWELSITESKEIVGKTVLFTNWDMYKRIAIVIGTAYCYKLDLLNRIIESHLDVSEGQR